MECEMVKNGKTTSKYGTSYSTVTGHLQLRYRTGEGVLLQINSCNTPW